MYKVIATGKYSHRFEGVVVLVSFLEITRLCYFLSSSRNVACPLSGARRCVQHDVQNVCLLCGLCMGVRAHSVAGVEPPVHHVTARAPCHCSWHRRPRGQTNDSSEVYRQPVQPSCYNAR